MRHHLIIAATIALLTEACKPPTTKLPLVGSEKDDATIEVVNTPTIARLTGYPEGSSGEHKIKINVEAVDEFQYKWGINGENNCQSPAAYSEFKPASEGIEIDLSVIPEDRGVINVCVLGKKRGEIQKDSSQAGWVWNAETPGGPGEITFVDGNNKLDATIKSSPGAKVLVARSKGISTWKPESGKEYKVGERFEDIIIVSVNALEFSDVDVKNEETWTYSLFTVNEAKRYSSVVYETFTLAKPDVVWVKKSDIKPEQKLVEPITNRWLCRVNGQPGRLFSNDDDPANGVCRYTFGTAIQASQEYEVLAGTKTDPMEILEYRTVQLDDEGKLLSIPNEDNKLVVGEENVDDEIFACISYTDVNQNNVLSIGKTGAHITGGCNQYIVQNTNTFPFFERVFQQNTNMKLLRRK